MAKDLPWSASNRVDSVPHAWAGSRSLVMFGYASRIIKKTRLEIERRLAPYGLSQPQAVIICLLSDTAGQEICQKDLEAALDLTNPTVTSILSNMLSKGLVEKKPGKTDKRMRVITLTEKGKSLYELSSKTLLDASSFFEENLSPQELDELDMLFRKALGIPLDERE